MIAETIQIQKQFTFAARREKKRLARVETVMDHLGIDEDQVLLLAMDGELAGFDLRGGSAERRLLCVWWQSIKDYEARSLYPGQAGAKIPTRTVIEDILPEGRRLRFTVVKQALGIKSQHLHNLIAAKLLTASGGDSVNQAPEIVRASVVSFLEDRRVA